MFRNSNGLRKRAYLIQFFESFEYLHSCAKQANVSTFGAEQSRLEIKRKISWSSIDPEF
ncbi:hypothetical protein [Synechococcus sp. M16CYN]|uniref:hypothetical protein n=1 Tax=Synechococcus sp. M16CYN TaxID=3103139 RepID=UPI00333E40AE